MEARLAAAKLSVEQLKSSIEAAKLRLQNGGFDSVNLPRKPLGPAPKKRRVFQGHYGKVYAVAWGGAPEKLVSARCVALPPSWHGFEWQACKLRPRLARCISPHWLVGWGVFCSGSCIHLGPLA